MKTPPDHLAKLRLPQYSLGVEAPEIFTPEEIAIIEKFGHWLDALASGEIRPFTQEQEDFVRVFRGQKEPETPHEIAWDKLVSRRAWERNNTIEYEAYDPKQRLFPDSGHWRYKS